MLKCTFLVSIAGLGYAYKRSRDELIAERRRNPGNVVFTQKNVHKTALNASKQRKTKKQQKRILRKRTE